MEYKDLLEIVERVATRKMKTPRDFEYLSDKIQQRTREYISSTTLKRMWGYLGSKNAPSGASLDILSRFAGFDDYTAFANRTGDTQSNAIMSRRIEVSDLSIGDRITLFWQPDRKAVIKYLGDGKFIVEEAENSKIGAGDTFYCHLFIEREPLYVDNICHNGVNHAAYVMGTENGVTFEIEN